jgi:hypothetical protein
MAKYGLKAQIETAQKNLAAWPDWMQDSELTVKGALLVADSTVDDGTDIHRHALKVLRAEVKRLQRIEKLYRAVRRLTSPQTGATNE